LNGKLVIRVGGGYMIIEEFINTYAEQELAKINKIQQNEKEKEMELEDDVDSIDIPPATRSKLCKLLLFNRTWWKWQTLLQEP
jgi:5-methylcytosine-specific restriction endonuclease McrBC GTP-binding regulatory subunit McrB